TLRRAATRLASVRPGWAATAAVPTSACGRVYADAAPTAAADTGVRRCAAASQTRSAADPLPDASVDAPRWPTRSLHQTRPNAAHPRELVHAPLPPTARTWSGTSRRAATATFENRAAPPPAERSPVGPRPAPGRRSPPSCGRE